MPRESPSRAWFAEPPLSSLEFLCYRLLLGHSPPWRPSHSVRRRFERREVEQEKLRIPNAKRGLQRTGHVDMNHAHLHVGKGSPEGGRCSTVRAPSKGDTCSS